MERGTGGKVKLDRQKKDEEKRKAEGHRGEEVKGEVLQKISSLHPTNCSVCMENSAKVCLCVNVHLCVRVFVFIPSGFMESTGHLDMIRH